MTARTIVVSLPPRVRTYRFTEAAAPGDTWLTQEAAARHIGVSVSMMSHYTNRDENPVPSHCPSPNVVRYSRAELDEWVRAQRGRSVAS